MKKSEFLTFNITVLPYNLIDKNTSSIKLYFNEQLILRQPLVSYNYNLRLSLSKECALFKKHQLHIVGENNCELKILELQINSTKFSNIEDQQLLIYKKHSNTHSFEFESPYAYYFLNRI